MRSLKIFILIGFLLLFGSSIATAVVWFLVQNEIVEPDAQVVEMVDAVSGEAVPADTTEAESESPPEPVPETQHGSFAEEVPEEGISIPDGALSETQEDMLGVVGIDADSFVLTPEMAACIEGVLGTDRVAEIIDGDLPGPIETVRIAACL